MNHLTELPALRRPPAVRSALAVDLLPRRTAHAVYALMAASDIGTGAGYGPFTAAEVCIYDTGEAFTPRHTAAALREAKKRGLVMYIPGGKGYWTPTFLALDHRLEFESRYLRYLRATDTGENA